MHGWGRAGQGRVPTEPAKVGSKGGAAACPWASRRLCWDGRQRCTAHRLRRTASPRPVACLPGAKPFHSAAAPSSRATVTQVPSSPLRSRGEQSKRVGNAAVPGAAANPAFSEALGSLVLGCRALGL
jgi:hypothetical protein